jgi:hypothetical protein
MRRSLQIGALAAMFAAGFLFGSVSRRPADAQLGEMGTAAGKAALNQAAGGGGLVGSAMELGTAIVDMQTHVDGLQKNLESLKKVKAALGG